MQNLFLLLIVISLYQSTSWGMQNKGRANTKTAMSAQAGKSEKKGKSIQEIRALLKNYGKICAGVDMSEVESTQNLKYLYMALLNPKANLALRKDLLNTLKETAFERITERRSTGMVQYAFSLLYRTNDMALGIEADEGEANDYLSFSAENGHIPAIVKLGIQFLKSHQALANDLFVKAIKEHECLPIENGQRQYYNSDIVWAHYNQAICAREIPSVLMSLKKFAELANPANKEEIYKQIISGFFGFDSRILKQGEELRSNLIADGDAKAKESLEEHNRQVIDYFLGNKDAANLLKRHLEPNVIQKDTRIDDIMLEYIDSNSFEVDVIKKYFYQMKLSTKDALFMTNFHDALLKYDSCHPWLVAKYFYSLMEDNWSRDLALPILKILKGTADKNTVLTELEAKPTLQSGVVRFFKILNSNEKRLEKIGPVYFFHAASYIRRESVARRLRKEQEKEEHKVTQVLANKQIPSGTPVKIVWDKSTDTSEEELEGDEQKLVDYSHTKGPLRVFAPDNRISDIRISEAKKAQKPSRRDYFQKRKSQEILEKGKERSTTTYQDMAQKAHSYWNEGKPPRAKAEPQKAIKASLSRANESKISIEPASNLTKTKDSNEASPYTVRANSEVPQISEEIPKLPKSRPEMKKAAFQNKKHYKPNLRQRFALKPHARFQTVNYLLDYNYAEYWYNWQYWQHLATLPFYSSNNAVLDLSLLQDSFHLHKAPGKEKEVIAFEAGIEKIIFQFLNGRVAARIIYSKANFEDSHARLAKLLELEGERHELIAQLHHLEEEQLLVPTVFDNEKKQNIIAKNPWVLRADPSRVHRYRPGEQIYAEVIEVPKDHQFDTIKLQTTADAVFFEVYHEGENPAKTDARIEDLKLQNENIRVKIIKLEKIKAIKENTETLNKLLPQPTSPPRIKIPKRRHSMIY